jgi:hypothetical protein
VPTITPKPARSAGARPLSRGDRGADVRALQRALDQRAAPRRYPAIVVDGELGEDTRRAWVDLGCALGLRPQTLDGEQIPIGGQRLVASPEKRSAAQIGGARDRADHLASRSILMDGTPLFWGLAAPLVQARARGWTGRVVSGDRRADVARRFGKRSQAELWSCHSRRMSTGSRPSDCGGDCLPAHPPGRSSHELCSDAIAFQGPVGRELPWWQLGLDVTASEQLPAILAGLGYRARRPYRRAAEDADHINFERSPGPAPPPTAHHGRRGGVHAKPRPVVTLTGPDVSQFQGEVSWSEVRHAGHAFAIVKATEGREWEDPRFGEQRWAALRAAGPRRGAYPKPYIPRPWRAKGFVRWQYTDRGRCPGIAGPCDLSRFRGAPAVFDRLGF